MGRSVFGWKEVGEASNFAIFFGALRALQAATRN